jgi:hypothetical protein
MLCLVSCNADLLFRSGQPHRPVTKNTEEPHLTATDILAPGVWILIDRGEAAVSVVESGVGVFIVVISIGPGTQGGVGGGGAEADLIGVLLDRGRIYRR